MKSQQAAEREEQLRIKNLVLNYDLREENEQQDGDSLGFRHNPFSPSLLEENPNTKGPNLLGSERYSASHSRSGQGSGRNSHRARKLQLSDVDWYGQKRPGIHGNRDGKLLSAPKYKHIAELSG